MSQTISLLSALVFTLLAFCLRPTPPQILEGETAVAPAIGSPEISLTDNARRVNVPYAAPGSPINMPHRTIFWLGQVNSVANYADVRLIYTDEALHVALHIFDRYLWFDNNPTAATLTQWDATTLSLDLNGNVGDAPSPSSYRFSAQLNNSPNRLNYQAAYRGNGTTWVGAAVPFTTTTGWRGDGLNSGAEARGWTVNYEIPFASLGLSGRPADGVIWGLRVAVHDRDNAAGTPPIADQLWPENGLPNVPASWGQIRFGGLPGYAPPFTVGRQTVIVRHGLNGAIVPDAQVGGDTVCGQPFHPNFFDGWGDANYAGSVHLNIQNQADVADWPCFSKLYVTFPLNAVPPGKAVVSATLRLHQFGNSLPSEAPRSNIHVFTVWESWQPGSVTWNNAPLAAENVAASWVDPISGTVDWPGLAREWNVSRAAAQAYERGEPLRLVLYASDGAYHSGKYFSSANVGDWNAAARPTLELVWGEVTEDYESTYLPLVKRP